MLMSVMLVVVVVVMMDEEPTTMAGQIRRPHGGFSICAMRKLAGGFKMSKGGWGLGLSSLSLTGSSPRVPFMRWPVEC